MMIKVVVFTLSILYILVAFVHSATYSETKTLYDTLTTNHNRYIRPKTDQTVILEVNIVFGLIALLDVNAVEGTVTVASYFYLNWIDEVVVWNPASHNNIEKIELPNDAIWKPPLVAKNSADQYEMLTMKDSYIMVTNTGESHWYPGKSVKFTCGIDTTYFPFDEQTCTLEIYVWGYTDTDVRLVSAQSTMDTDIYSANTEWDLLSTKSTDGNDHVTFEMRLRRRPSYYVINILLPVVFLAFLNIFVFLLPQESGERLGFAITSLLSIVVFLTIAQGLLPVSALPRLSGICILLTIDMFMSGAITISVIVSSWLYYRSEEKEIPKLVRRMISTKCGRKCSKSQNIINVTEKNLDCEKCDQDERTINWQEVSRAFDTFSLVLYSSWLVLSIIVYTIDVLIGTSKYP